jgi:hypothetical protein
MKRKIGAWALFLSFFLFLQLGATSHWKIADQAYTSGVSAKPAYMFFGFAAMGVISILVVRRKWRSVLERSSRRE